MKTPTWRVRAARVIENTVSGYLAGHGLDLRLWSRPQVLRSLSPQQARELRTLLRAAYPWGEREAHPYRAWCQEQREVLRHLPLPRDGEEE